MPAIGKLVSSVDGKKLCRDYGHPVVVAALREAVAIAQVASRNVGHTSSDGLESASEADIFAEARRILATRDSLRRVINATGVVLHTNLGRAPLAALARQRALDEGYISLEFDLQSGQRGGRHIHTQKRLTQLTGAPDALVVNNAAAALLLALTALSKDATVIISRGELIEIGGGFRIPEIIASCGARLVEVGTTNRTRVADYANALERLGPVAASAILLKVHRSNFAMVGFTEETRLEELVALAQQYSCRVVFDQGSGLLLPGLALGLGGQPDVPTAVRSGANVIIFSGDKLLGGPQAGIAVGSTKEIAVMRQHPLNRALRPGKLVLAALDATLELYEVLGPAVVDEIPTLRMLTQSSEEVRARAERLQQLVGHGTVVPSKAQVGAGAEPITEIPSFALSFFVLPNLSLTQALRSLRLGSPAVVGRIEKKALVLDLRTVADVEVQLLADACASLFSDEKPPSR